ncbi:hypothetical protein [Enterococcus sp. LJL90]
MILKNGVFSINISDTGNVKELYLLDDPRRMNWVISDVYLQSVQYNSVDKLFGNFEIEVENRWFKSYNNSPSVIKKGNCCSLRYEFDLIEVLVSYDLTVTDQLVWKIQVENKHGLPIKIQNFILWASFAYAMFRDINVEKNIFHSAAFFPSISKDFFKAAIMRRTTQLASLGLYQLSGQTFSVGSYCDFSNQFFKAVSPSLDGVIYHNFILAGESMRDTESWLYPFEQITIPVAGSHEWSFCLKEVQNQEDFYQTAEQLGQPRYKYAASTLKNQDFSFDYSGLVKIERATIEWMEKGEKQKKLFEKTGRSLYKIHLNYAGEHKITIFFENGKQDTLIINVLGDLKQMIEERVTYLCEVSYDEESGAFKPFSNQGESLGKMSLILKKNLLGDVNRNQIEKVEGSLQTYVLPKWFKDNDFYQPRQVYGDFYRVMDFEYLGHLLYLLSQFPEEYLTYEKPDTYLKWAAQVVEVRINPETHVGFREKEESEMLGVFFLYIDDLLSALEKKEPTAYSKLNRLWENNLFKILEEKQSFSAAKTEHYFDNAGFGPAAASLVNAGYDKASYIYSDLLLANIGFSNDFRMQNPDRWWEALSYMIHSLWGGISAAAALDVFHGTKDPRYLEASYRAFSGVLYCYDTHATATNELKKGEAASTFSCVNPHINRPDLAHKRFGQEVFAKDGGIFSEIFSDDVATGDWDMGEELVAYLDCFGQDAYGYFDADNYLRLVNCHFEFVEGEECIINDAPFPRQIYILLDDDFKIFTTKCLPLAIIQKVRQD